MYQHRQRFRDMPSAERAKSKQEAYMCAYIGIERARARERQREREIYIYMYIYRERDIYIYIYHTLMYMCTYIHVYMHKP